jgi:Na+-transporting NADH:ubiquinone oxidoreductase subunit C
VASPDPRPLSWLQRFRALPKDSAPKTLLFSLALCLACSLVVSAAAIWLRPMHRKHQERGQRGILLEMLQQQPGLSELLGGIDASAIETRIVNLDTGEESTEVDPADYDERAAATDPARSTPIPKDRDFAGVGRRARWARVYVIRHEGQLRSLILPIYGRGYGGLIHGYLALEGDANTIAGISFHEHAETPGIGDQITEPEWRERWRGKQVRGGDGAVQIRVVDTKAPAAAGDALHRVDAIGGATRSSQGVGNMVRFWLGDDGFGPYLRSIK